MNRVPSDIFRIKNPKTRKAPKEIGEEVEEEEVFFESQKEVAVVGAGSLDEDEEEELNS